LAIGVSPACATKAFVRKSVGEVNQKVDALSRSLEQTQASGRALNRRVVVEVLA
jgi:outer membrane protein OmpA-like peptidoglycan-associated protein